MCQFYNSLHFVIYLYSLVLIVYAVLSWVPDLRGGWARYLDMMVEPVLTPVRRIIPPAGGIDWSFMVVMVLLYLLNMVISRLAFSACYTY